MTRAVRRTRVGVVGGRLEQYRGDALAIGLFKDTKRLPAELAGLDRVVGGGLSELLRLGDFSGKAGETAVIYAAGKAACRRVILVGLGDRKKLEINVLRQSAGTAARVGDKLAARQLGMGLHLLAAGLDGEQAGQALAEGAIIGRYEYEDYLPEKQERSPAVKMRVSIVEPQAGRGRKLAVGCRRGTAVAEGQNLARMLANRPGNEIDPPRLAAAVRRLARQYGLRCRILGDKQLATMGMNMILAVGSGSAHRPRLIRLEYAGRRGRGRAGGPDVVLVGKSITFDSGGLSLKPSESMMSMKFDKCGGCNVVGIMAAAAALKLPLHIVGLLPAAENLPSHTAFRPDDIIRTYSGKTVEVQNTDAEGRLVLGDALAYAAELKPRAIVDLATLTGAMRVALGEHHAGLFGNDEKLREAILAASRHSGEPVWPLPSGPEYLEQMRSKVADLKNVGGRAGGSCTAAAFLGEFVKDTPWAHLDLAAVADTDKEKSWRGIGATGFGVRLVLEYLRSLT